MGQFFLRSLHLFCFSGGKRKILPLTSFRERQALMNKLVYESHIKTEMCEHIHVYITFLIKEKKVCGTQNTGLAQGHSLLSRKGESLKGIL